MHDDFGFKNDGLYGLCLSREIDEVTSEAYLTRVPLRDKLVMISGPFPISVTRFIY